MALRLGGVFHLCVAAAVVGEEVWEAWGLKTHAVSALKNLIAVLDFVK